MFPINLSFYCPSMNVHEKQTIATFLSINHLNVSGLIMLSLFVFSRLSNPKTFPVFFVDHVFQASAHPHWSHLQSSPSLLKHIPAEVLSGSVSIDSKYLIYALPMRVSFLMKCFKSFQAPILVTKRGKQVTSVFCSDKPQRHSHFLQLSTKNFIMLFLVPP